MKSYHVCPNVRESEFHNLKGFLKERHRLNNRSIQPGTQEALEVDTPNGKIMITYYKNGKMMVQSSPSNPEYELLVNDIIEYFSDLVENYS